ncbi:CDP-glycerol glycerophosphotransferase family protein [Candidatus Parcubacteria bacterium]|nr:CDP-glycerol glycerophosphotransferase family protein [Candidatus Parcubacteria bacterium]
MRIVLVVPDYKKDYFTKTFGGANIIVEGIKSYQSSRTKRGLFFKKLGYFLFHTDTAATRKRYEYYCTGKYGYYYFAVVLGFIGQSFFVRKVVRYIDLHFSPKGFFTHLFEKYMPDAVFSTDIQNENDVSLMQEARLRHIPIIGMIRSWDNPTQRINRIYPDRLLVGSQCVHDEMIELCNFPKNRMKIVGNPHYDKYKNGSTKSREEFCAHFGIDSNKPFVLFAPIGDHLIRHNDVDQYIMEILSDVPVQFLVRFPPDEAVRLVNFKQPANMAYDKTGVAFSAKELGDREISSEDDERLINSLYHAAFAITGPTSIPLDAALIDKPSIVVHFYPSERGFCASIYSFWVSHIRKLINTRGVHFAESKQSLLDGINAYLADPRKDAEGRKKIRSLWFSHADGKASDRVAWELTSFLGI